MTGASAATLTAGTETRPGLGVRVAVRTMKAYQAAASGRISPCRFYPSCSNYAVEAFTEHGFWRGLSLTARRLIRCRPFGPHGVDLVPLAPGQAHHHVGEPSFGPGPGTNVKAVPVP
ncbi:MAG TPA: membrane protein insertion efficiency factor YidD [Acidimicrobiales bacterium]|nr:membrane protein insertion efficiency factor YidD [Acidimicrobiales bacterium]